MATTPSNNPDDEAAYVVVDAGMQWRKRSGGNVEYAQLTNFVARIVADVVVDVGDDDDNKRVHPAQGITSRA